MRIYIQISSLFFFIFSTGEKKEYTKVFWNENRILVCGYFKGKTDAQDENIAALSFCGIGYSSCRNGENKRQTYQVVSYFAPELSLGKKK